MILRTNPFHQDPAPASPARPLLKLAGSPSFDPGTVSYLQGDGNYTVVHFIDGRTLLTAITLVEVARRIPDLLRVHKSFAIAPQGVSALRWVNQAAGRRVLVVTLRNQVRITIPRRRGREVAVELAHLTGLLIGG